MLLSPRHLLQMASGTVLPWIPNLFDASDSALKNGVSTHEVKICETSSPDFKLICGSGNCTPTSSRFHGSLRPKSRSASRSKRAL